MVETVDIDIAAIAGSKFCTASEDGQKIYNLIVQAIRSGRAVRLSFIGVEDLTSSFLNSAIGQLYGEFSEEDLKGKLLPPVSASSEDLLLLKKVVDRAKEFFREPERFRKAAAEELGEDRGGEPH